ncbi:insulin/IGF/Relaxin family domain-containing protein [Ditylenchus destructor]|nr:insulin/IGF/Relaxin family domain-containing protein [Ditylenchus destructor]
MFVFRKRKRLSINYEHCRNFVFVITAFLCLLPAPSEASFRLCGFRLTMTLTAICKNQLCGGYFVPTRKRSDTSPLLSHEEVPPNNWQQPPNFDSDDENEDEDASLALAPVENTGSRFTRFHKVVSKRSGGIATECCEKRCSLAYLRTYCCAGFQIAPNPAVQKEQAPPQQPVITTFQ